MSFSKDQEKILRGNGYRQSIIDSDKYINGNGHSIKSNGGTTIFDTDRHTTNGTGISNSTFDKKAK